MTNLDAVECLKPYQHTTEGARLDHVLRRQTSETFDHNLLHTYRLEVVTNEEIQSISGKFVTRGSVFILHTT